MCSTFPLSLVPLRQQRPVLTGLLTLLRGNNVDDILLVLNPLPPPFKETEQPMQPDYFFLIPFSTYHLKDRPAQGHLLSP